MIYPLKPADRVLVTVYGRWAGHQPGEKGAVLRTPPPAAAGIPSFVVALDKHRPDTEGVLLAECEIEPDVG
jgi:hypothetical protein